MNLSNLFDSLSLPPKENKKTFSAIPIPGYSNFRIGIDVEGNPVLFLAIAGNAKNSTLKNYRLKYLQLEQNQECKIIENNKILLHTFTIITFTNAGRDLQEYFFQISEILIKSISMRPTQQEIIETLNNFVEVFRALNDIPQNTVQGLWAELFFIDNSANTRALVNYWHNSPDEKFDFDAGLEKIEVKSSSNYERKHIFSTEQINPPVGTQVLIASIFVRQIFNGKNIQDLMDSITGKIQSEIKLVEKLNSMVYKTLGSSLEQSLKIKFDYEIAKDSLCFYKHQDISKIEPIHIPIEVSDVKYKSDLSTINPIDIQRFVPKRDLFSCI